MNKLVIKIHFTDMNTVENLKKEQNSKNTALTLAKLY